MLARDGRRWRRQVAAERSDGGGFDATGSERVQGDAHQVRGAVTMLNMVIARRGAHGGDGNRSPELGLAPEASACRRGRGGKG